MEFPEKIVFATNNAHKIREVRDIVGERCQVLSLADIGCEDDIPETADTLEENALMKARWVKSRYGYDCFADDTGLEVDSLGGEPGVYSARYASVYGESSDHDSKANMRVLLQKLGETDRREARFRTVIALVTDNEEKCFEGKVEGNITRTPSGTDGFGYDPIFLPVGKTLTFAEMTSEEKNSMSHRGRAIASLMDYLYKE